MLTGVTPAQTRYGVEVSQHRMTCRDMLRTGSPQALCYAAVVMMPQLSGNGAMDLFTRNYVFKAGFWAWLSAQTLKVLPSSRAVSCVISSALHLHHDLAIYEPYSRSVLAGKIVTHDMACTGLHDIW